MGIFRRVLPQRKSLNDVSCPVFVEREEVVKLASKSKHIDSSVSVVQLVKTPIENYVCVLPSAEEYDLEEMIKAGVSPQMVDVHGILPSNENYDLKGNVQKLVDEMKKNSDSDVSINI